MEEQNFKEGLPVGKIFGIIQFIVACLGILGNSAAVVYFGRKKYRKGTFFILLRFLAVMDNFFLVIFILLNGTIERISGDFHSITMPLINTYYNTVLMSLEDIAKTGTVYLTLAICIERYLVICHPFLRVSVKISWKHYVLPTLCLMIILNPIFGSYYFLMRYYNYQENSSYMLFVLHLREITLIYIPFLVLIVLNFFIVKELIKSRNMFNGKSAKQKNIETISETTQMTNQSSVIIRRRENNVALAKLSLVIDVLFIISHGLNYHLIAYVGLKADLVVEILSIGVIFNSSANFYIYVLKRSFNRK